MPGRLKKRIFPGAKIVLEEQLRVEIFQLEVFERKEQQKHET